MQQPSHSGVAAKFSQNQEASRGAVLAARVRRFASAGAALAGLRAAGFQRKNAESMLPGPGS